MDVEHFGGLFGGTAYFCLGAASRMFCTRHAPIFLVLKVDDVTEVGPHTGGDARGASEVYISMFRKL